MISRQPHGQTNYDHTTTDITETHRTSSKNKRNHIILQVNINACKNKLDELNIHHIPHTNIQHTSTLQATNTIFNNNHYTTNISIDPHTVTTTTKKTNIIHIHTSIVFRHLATRGNTNIYVHTSTTHLHLLRDTSPVSIVAPFPK